MIFSFIKFLLWSVLFTIPGLSSSAPKDYDGKWEVEFSCSAISGVSCLTCSSMVNTLATNQNQSEFNEKNDFILTNGSSETKITRNNNLGEEQTVWSLLIKNTDVIIEGEGKKSVASWQWKLKGKITNENTFNADGVIYGSGRRLRDCKAVGRLVDPVQASIVGLKVKQQEATVNQTTKVLPCSQAPLSGPPFKECKVSTSSYQNQGSSNSTDIEIWAMDYADPNSEFSIGFEKPKNQDTGGVKAISNTDAISYIKNNIGIKSVTSGGENWMNYRTSGEDLFVDFTKPNKKCLGYLRQGPSKDTNTKQWIMTGAFCKKSETPMYVDEAKFIIDMIKVK